jgi:hypothetical protein
MISQKLSEPLHNLIMKSEPALADLHRIPDATLLHTQMWLLHPSLLSSSRIFSTHRGIALTA